jgi:hypothetical protein
MPEGGAAPGGISAWRNSPQAGSPAPDRTGDDGGSATSHDNDDRCECVWRTGATDFTGSMLSYYPARAVSWPASDPLVTAVGGTQLSLRASGTRRKPDVAWAGSGGGRSPYFVPELARQAG